MKQLYRHKKTGKFYNLVSDQARMKVPETGEWVDAVVYSPEYKNEYRYFTREYDKFFEEFEFAGEELWDEDEDKWEVNIDEELVNKYDGKCYIDFDMNDRIEAVCFYRTKKGLGSRTIGCDYHWGYNHEYEDEFGTHDWQDTFCGAYIHMIETNCYLLKEIPKEEFEKILAIVIEQIRKSNEMSAEFEKLQKPFGINV